MNIHNPELQRQHEAAMARKARLWGPKDKPEPVHAALPAPAPKPVLVQQDYHVSLYRLHRFYFPANLSTSASFHVELVDDYQPYHADISFDVTTPKPLMRSIALEVLKDYPGITIDDLKGEKRTTAIVRPRQIAMFEIARQRPDKSYPEIGRFFGGRDHTTVLHSVKRAKEILGVSSDEECWADRSAKRVGIIVTTD